LHGIIHSFKSLFQLMKKADNGINRCLFRGKLVLKGLFMLAGFFWSVALQAQPITNYFDFNGNFDPRTPSAQGITQSTSCSANQGSFVTDVITTRTFSCGSANTFAFEEGGGIDYDNTNHVTNEYSIHVFVKFSSLSSYTRVIDFSNSLTDAGIYVRSSGYLNFFPTGDIGPDAPFVEDTYYLLSFTRNGETKEMKVFVDGVLYTTYQDDSDTYISDGSPLIFFRDDNVVPCEDGAGNVRLLVVSDTYDDEETVAALWDDIGELLGGCVNTFTYDFSDTFAGLEEDAPALTETTSCSAAQGAFEQDAIVTRAGSCGSAPTFRFNEGGGVVYPNTNHITTSYNIHVLFKFSSLSSYNRVIDFSNSQEDAGIYVRSSGALNFFPTGNIGPDEPFVTDTYYLLSFTRNSATKEMKVYVDGVPYTTYDDASDTYISNGSPLVFFRDDNSVPCEDASGNVKLLIVSNEYLDDEGVASLWEGVCDLFEGGDSEPPTINCNSYTATFNGEQMLNLDATQLATASDESGIASLVATPGMLSCAQLGQTVPVTVVATDNAGNMAACVSQVTVGGLPCGWRHNNGSVGDCNSAVSFSTQTGVWTGGATNCRNSSPFQSDKLMFAQYTLCGDGSITAQVAGLSGGMPFGGICMRESNDPGAKKVQMSINRSSNIVRREIRNMQGGQAFPMDFSSPCERTWLRIVRTGNMFRGYTSMDGITWWYVMQVHVPMNSCIEIGLVLTNMQQNVPGTVTFANVSVTGTGSTPTITTSGDAISQDMEAALDVQVYPNPASETVQVDLSQFSGRAVSVAMYAISGQLVRLVELDEVQEHLMPIAVHDLTEGMYLLQISTPGMPVTGKKIVIQHNK
jgi:hypothetical protein